MKIRLFYNFIENSRFKSTYGLKYSLWIEKIARKCKNKKLELSQFLKKELELFLSSLILKAGKDGLFSVSTDDIGLFLNKPRIRKSLNQPLRLLLIAEINTRNKLGQVL